MDKSETPGGTGVIVPLLDTRLHNTVFIKTFSIRLFPGPGLSLSFQTSFTCIESYDLQCHQASAFVMPFIATLSRLETGQSGQAALISLIYVTAINGK